MDLDSSEVAAALDTGDGPAETPVTTNVEAVVESAETQDGKQEEVEAEETKLDIDMVDCASPSPAPKAPSAVGTPMVVSTAGTPVIDKSSTGSPVPATGTPGMDTPSIGTPAAEDDRATSVAAVEEPKVEGVTPSNLDLADATALDNLPDIKPDLDALVDLNAFELPPPPPPQQIKAEILLEHVDVDLGPLKSVSRNHAKIEYRVDCGQFCLEIFGRNGAWVDDRYYVKGTVVPLNQG